MKDTVALRRLTLMLDTLRGDYLRNSKKTVGSRYAARICMEAVVKHRFKTYDVTERFDRICVLLRPGDFETLRANYPYGVSHWIRERVAERCDEIIAEQERRAKAERKALLAAIRDPNL